MTGRNKGGDATEISKRAEPGGIKHRWYHNVWFVLFLLFFVLGPFGLPLVWKNPRFSQTVKVLLTVLVGLYTLFLVNLIITMYQAVMNEVRQFNSTLSY